MDAQSKTEMRIAKLVDEAIEKIEELNGPKAPPAVREKLQAVLRGLALKAAIGAAPEKCKECDGKLDPRFRDRCAKHIAMLLAADFGRAQIREHGPTIAMKAAAGIQGWLEKFGSPAEPDAHEEKTEEAS